MPGNDGSDDDWTFDGEATRRDDAITPIPEAVPDTVPTGKYQTLSGFEAAAAREISGARDMLLGRDQMLVGLKLWLMSKRMHPDAADARVEEFRAWVNTVENEELIQAAMRKR